ncbi:Uncharacterised protein [Legionella wadsworthii]|uniref:Uncharacterized protein n=1 Tax=Legionella wadsworthii TaxID=28088 RepID=A0A378LSU1_9GAMM|nr:Uncharacterised protein [Legionella wadsworthii]
MIIFLSAFASIYSVNFLKRRPTSFREINRHMSWNMELGGSHEKGLPGLFQVI